MKKRSGKEKLLVALAFIAILALVLAFVLTGNNRELTKQVVGSSSREQLDELTDSLGIGGHVTIVLLAMLQTLCPFLPSEPVQLLAGVAYGFAMGMLLFIIGFALAISIVYFLYKVYGEKIQNYFIKEMHLDRENVSQSNRVSLIIFLLYILPGIPYAMICFIYAGLGVKYRKYMPVNIIGAIPSSCIGIGLGHLTVMSSSNWILSAILFVLVVAIMIILIRKKEWLFDNVNKLAVAPGYTSQTQVRKRAPVSYWLNCRLAALRLFFRGVRVKVRRKCEKKLPGPCIVLCNNDSAGDLLFIAKALRKNNFNFVTERRYFYCRSLGRKLKRLGGIPESMFTGDPESTQNCMRVLEEGRVLVLMQHAGYSVPTAATAELLKNAGVPVYTVCLQGNRFAAPKWSKGLHRGAVVEAETELLFAAEQLKELSTGEIARGVDQRLQGDSFTWLDSWPKVRYRGPLAEGLENILYLCPNCGGHFSIQTKKREVLCQNCGPLTKMDKRYGFIGDFRFPNYARWYIWQKEELKKQIRENADYRLESRVQLHHGDERGKRMTRTAGEGICSLSREGLRYQGSQNGKTVDILFPVDKLCNLLFRAGESFEIYGDDKLFCFLPEEPRSAVLWHLASTLLHDLHFGKKPENQ